MSYKIFFRDKSAFHHDPADGSLDPSQQEEYDQRKDHILFKLSFQEKPDKADCKNDPHQARPKAVKPFPEENELEIGERKI